MDIYTPATQIALSSAPQSFPIAFIIHGGAWVEGDKSDYDTIAKQLTVMGYAGVSVNYSLATGPGGQFPGPVEDLRCALKTLRSRSNELHLDPTRVVAIGSSAGGHLVAEIALTSDLQNTFDDSACPVQGFGVDVQGVIGYYGPYDLRSSAGLNVEQLGILTNFLGGIPELDPTEAALASPQAQLRGQQIPILLSQAVNDDTVPVRSSRDFSAGLIAAKMPQKYVEITDGGHGYDLFDSQPYAQPSTCAALDYLTKFQAGQDPLN